MVLSPVLRELQRRHVVLASASPRRREILSSAGLRFEAVPSRFKETLSQARARPQDYAMDTAAGKALEVARRVHQKDLRTPDLVIGADTIVAVDGLILEKPVDKQDAYRMLSRLSGKEHSVFTGVALVRCRHAEHGLETQVWRFYEETRVRFSELSEELLWEYIDSGEPMDKAGGYGIQALGGMLVEAVRGDFLNVVGFPLNHFCKKLGEIYGAGAAASAPGLPQAASEAEARPPCPARLLHMMDGFREAQALLAACRLQVFDALLGGPLPAPALAARLGVPEAGARRLLDACEALGLLRRSPAGYENSALAAAYLAGADSLRPLVLQLDAPRPDAALTGAAARTQAPSGPAPLLVAPEPPSPSAHAHALAGLWARSITVTFDLSRFRTACHVGGGAGGLARALARLLPGLRLRVFDAPAAMAGVEAEEAEEAGGGAVAFEAGDVFADSLPEADLYVLSGLPHRWPARRVRRLLRRVAAASSPGCGLLLVDALGARSGRRRALERLLQVEEAAEVEAEDEEAAEAEVEDEEAAEAEAEDEEAAEAGVRRLLARLGFGQVQAAPGLELLLAARAAS